MTDTALVDSAPVDTAIFDVDGTLVDSNYQHALAWFRAFRRHDITLPLWRLHRAIGMGGDKLVEHVAGEKVEQQLGDALRAAWEDEFKTMIDEVRPFDGARSLLEAVRDRGFRIVLASSGKTDQVEKFLDLIGGKDLADAWTTSDDADDSKPAPDIVQVALDRVSGAKGCDDRRFHLGLHRRRKTRHPHAGGPHRRVLHRRTARGRRHRRLRLTHRAAGRSGQHPAPEGGERG